MLSATPRGGAGNCHSGDAVIIGRRRRATLHLCLGPVHSGKSRYLRGRLAESLGSGREIYYVVPEQFSYETERDLLREFGVAGANRVRVRTFTKLCGDVQDAAGGGLEPVADDGVKTVCMMSALESVRGELLYYGRSRKSPAFAEAMLSVMDELSQYGVAPEDLEAAAASDKVSSHPALADKLRDIRLIYEAYRAALGAKFVDANDRVFRAAGKAGDSGAFRGAEFFFDAFNSFTESEYAMLSAVLSLAAEVFVALPCDGNIYVPDDISTFSAVRKEARRLLDAARAAGVAAEEPVVLDGTDYAYPELRHLERVLSERESGAFPGDAGRITVVGAANVYDELDYILCETTRLVAEEGYRYRDIAVVVRDPDAYYGALSGLAKKYGVPVRFDKSRALADTPVFKLLYEALLASGSCDSEKIFNMLRTGLLPFSESEISALESYCRVWDIDRAGWRRAWTGNPGGLEPGFDRAALDSLNELRRRVLDCLSPLKSAAPGTLRDISLALYRFIEANGVPDALRRMSGALTAAGDLEGAGVLSTAYDRLIAVFDKLADCSGGDEVSREMFAELFSLCAAAEPVGEVPRRLDSVMFCSSEMARVTDAKAVFLAGVNEGEQPYVAAKSGLFTGSEREELIKAGLNIRDDLLSAALDGKFKFYASACAAGERVYFLYSATDFSLRGAEPSAVLDEIRAAFPACREVYHSARGADFSRVYAKTPAFEKALLGSAAGDSRAARALSYFKDDPEFSGKLRRLLADDELPSLTPPVAKRLYGSEFYVSASGTETFFTCPFRYFCRYGLGVSAPASGEFDALRSGTAIHFFLEKFVSAHMADIASAAPRDIEREVEAIGGVYLGEIGLAEETLPPELSYRFRELKRQAVFTLRDISEEFRQSDFIPAACELRIGKGGAEPLTVPFAGGVITSGGVADRVDTATLGGREYIRVVDYKTGGKSFSVSDVLSGLNMQMLLYLAALRKAYPVSPGAVLYKPVTLSAVGEDKLPAGRDRLCSDGLLSREDGVLAALDRSGRFVNPGRNGEKTARAEDFDVIFRGVERELREMGERLHGGDIRQRPVWRGEKDKSPCRYCDYKRVCLSEREGERLENGSGVDGTVAAILRKEGD